MSYNSLFRTPPATRLLLMDLDESSGTSITDNSGKGNHGTIANNSAINYAVTGPTPWLPAAIEFANNRNDGPSYIDLPTTLQPANITLSAWVYDTGDAPGNPIICCDDGSYNDFSLRVKTSGSSQYLGCQIFTTGGGYKQIQYPTTAGEYINRWFHLAMTYDGANIKLYVDGVLKLTDTTGSGNIDYPGIVRTAIAYDQSQSQYWAGKTAQISIDSVALTDTDIAETVAGPEPISVIPNSLSTDGTGSVGMWSSQGNGTILYSTKLYLASDDSLVATSGASSFDFSGDITGGLAYYAVTRASNDGGYDSAEDQTTADVTMAGGSVPSTGYGSVDGTGTLTGVGLSTRYGSGSIDATGSLAGVGASPQYGSGSINTTGTLTGVGEAPLLTPASGYGSIDATGSLAGRGFAVQSGSGSIDSTGTLIGVGLSPTLGVKTGYGSIDAVGSLVGVGQSIHSGSGSIDGTGSLAGIGHAPTVGEKSGSGTISGAGTLPGVGARESRGVSSISATTAIIGVGYQSPSGLGTITAVGTLVGVGSSDEATNSIIAQYYNYLAT